jgi:hypothetical protein
VDKEQIRKDESLRKVQIEDYSEDIHAGPVYLEALLQNPWITDLDILTLFGIPFETGPLIRSKPNLKVLRIFVVVGDDSAGEALSANQTIETLRLDFHHNTSQEANLIIRSISNHPRITCLVPLTWACAVATTLTTVLECLEHL